MYKSNLCYRCSVSVMILLLGACTNSEYDIDEQFIDINTNPQIQADTQQRNTPVKKQKISHQSTTDTSSSLNSHEVFTLLERDKYHVQKPYEESTRKIKISEISEFPPVEEEIIKETSVADIEEKPVVKEKDDVKVLDPKTQLNSDCVQYCGEGYFYDRKGSKNNGQELVCTKYPLKCGYKCTHGWNFRYLVSNTNYTCQEAKQTAQP